MGTGFDTLNFQVIETAIKDRIRAEVPEFKTVDAYAGEVDDALKGLPVQMPAALVLFDGESLELVDGPNHSHDSRFSVIVMTSSFKKTGDAVSGAAGAYGLIRSVITALTNQNFGLEIERLRPLGTSLVMATSTFAAYLVRFSTSYDTEFSW